MNARAVAVTGLGILSSLGDEVSTVNEALSRGARAFKPSTLVEGKDEAPIVDFDAARYANIRGMRVYNRMTQLAICAAKRALDHGKFEPSESSGAELGVITASTYGHLDTLLQYDRSLLKVGIARTNPAWMPLAIGSAPGAAVALAFHAKAFSVTLSDAQNASLDALGLGLRLLRDGRAKACLVVGAFALCRELSLSADRAGLLCTAEHLRPFDRTRSGTVFGEAAVALMLETAEAAQARQALPLALLSGQASSYASQPVQRPAALARAIEVALRDASTPLERVAFVSASASGSSLGDQAEARGLLTALAEHAAQVPVSAVKSSFGEAIDASGLLQTFAAIEALRTRKAPPIAALNEPDVAGLRYARDAAELREGAALVTSLSAHGSASALLISAPP